MSEPAVSWMVTWMTAWGSSALVDLDTEADALAMARGLAELGRRDVRVTRCEYEVDEDLRRRIWQRVQDRLREAPKEFVL
ncbi:MAG: hypothetical protein KatS3mg064_0583 [Tepidiforma sp.]|nr:hypothetical protein [Tepidiforma sp.]GIW17426.1 MAG: hypothetical protein KatS3mg064_0583 [Tepidiforma sp.]